MQVQNPVGKGGRVEAEICLKKKFYTPGNLHPKNLSRQKRKDWFALKSHILEEF